MNDQNLIPIDDILNTNVIKIIAKLPQEKQYAILESHAEAILDNTVEFKRLVSKSNVAENDMNVMLENVRRLESDRKMYSAKGNFKTGSGEVKIEIRGGDTRFIVPILIVIAIVIIFIAFAIFN